MNVFVFTPVYRIEPETVRALLLLEWSGGLTLHLQRDNPYVDGRENITHQYRAGRCAFLAGPYEAMLVIESDIIPPSDTLMRLASLQADVAYGHYVFRCAGQVSNIFERYPGTPRNEGESLSVWPTKYRAAKRQGVIACSGAGLGCALIQRSVLEQFDFRHPADDGGCCDTWFNRDVLRAGMLQRADLNLVCGHKDVDGRVLWPS